ncbi:MAG: hypothetical protein LBN05_00500 [Oscillospiraceae bacterium]|nr:hypothetical protein [Oscillospiraceae bacterium]
MKKIISVLVAVLVLIGASAALLTASAQTQVKVPDQFHLLAGGLIEEDPRTSARRPDGASYAWLEDVFIRERSASLTYVPVEPIDAYPFGSTLASFKLDVQEYLDALNAPQDPIAMLGNITDIFNQLRIALYTLGIDASPAEQKIWLEENTKIDFSKTANAAIADYLEPMTTLLYATQRYNLGGIILGAAAPSLPENVGLEEAAVLTMKELFTANGDATFDNIKTLKGLVIALMRTYLVSQHVSLSDYATDEQVLRATILAVIAQAGYTSDADSTTMADEQLKLYELGAELFLRFRVVCPPAALGVALQSVDPTTAVARVILETMICEKSKKQPADLATKSMEDLFNDALILGYFALTSDFYSDVYEYNVHLDYKESKLYLMAFPYAPLMDPAGYSGNITYKINGQVADLRKALEIALNPALEEQLIDLEVVYKDDRAGINETRHYLFRIFEGKNDPPNDGNPFVDIASLLMGGSNGNLLASLGSALSPVYSAKAPDATTPASTVSGWEPATVAPHAGAFPEVLTDPNAAEVLGAFTVVDPQNSPLSPAGAGSPASASAPKTGLAALWATMTRNNLALYIAIGLVVVAAAAALFIHDHKKQEAEHAALGFKPKKNGKSAKNKKPKPDDRF